MTPQALVLDLDGTLLDDGAAIRAAFGVFAQTHRRWLGDEPEAASLRRWREVSGRHWARFERGELSFAQQRRERAREFLRQPFDDDGADAAFAHYGEAYEAAWTLAPGCAEFMERTARLPKVIVTNGEREQQRRKLQLSGLQRHVRAAITPEDCGVWKPDPGMFEAALALLGVEPAACLMVGDDPLKDIAPARALGMQGFLVEIGRPGRGLLDALDEAGR